MGNKICTCDKSDIGKDVNFKNDNPAYNSNARNSESTTINANKQAMQKSSVVFSNSVSRKSKEITSINADTFAHPQYARGQSSAASTKQGDQVSLSGKEVRLLIV